MVDLNPEWSKRQSSMNRLDASWCMMLMKQKFDYIPVLNVHLIKDTRDYIHSIFISKKTTSKELRPLWIFIH